MTSGLGSSVLAALDVGAAVLAPKENGVDPLEEAPPPVLPKLKMPPAVSFGLFSDTEQAGSEHKHPFVICDYKFSQLTYSKIRKKWASCRLLDIAIFRMFETEKWSEV